MYVSRYPENTSLKAHLKCSDHIASFFHLPMEPPLQCVMSLSFSSYDKDQEEDSGF